MALNHPCFQSRLYLCTSMQRFFAACAACEYGVWNQWTRLYLICFCLSHNFSQITKLLLLKILLHFHVFEFCFCFLYPFLFPFRIIDYDMSMHSANDFDPELSTAIPVSMRLDLAQGLGTKPKFCSITGGGVVF